MRWLCSSLLAFLAISSLANRGFGGDQTIPQNPARQEKAFQDLLDWNRRTMGGAYEKVGKKNAKWDVAAREALEAAARVAGKAIDPAAGPEDVFAPARRAVEAGCDDPMILFLYADSSVPPNQPDPAELQRRWDLAATAIDKSGYPPLRRALALLSAGKNRTKKEGATAEDRKEAARRFDRVLALIPSAAAKEESNADAEDEWFRMIWSLIAESRAVSGNLQTEFNRVDSILARSPSLKTIRMQMKARTLIEEAWDTRGNGLGNSVPEESQRIFEAKNEEAYKILQQVWTFNNKNYRTPNMILSVITSLGRERAEMEMWFRRAMELKDANAAACTSKLNYLDPKWYGSREEMMEFAQACKATKNWRGGITIVAVPAHYRWAMQLEQAEATQYWYTPAVWEDGKPIYEEYLSHYTKDNAIRSDFAGFAYFCGHRADSARQFKLLGENIVGSKFYPIGQLMQFKESLEQEEKREAEAKARTPKP